ncbi:Eukaryotic translation initiation factor 3 110 kDa subunit [Methanocaldococcus lauensis]|nr:Eukaryotic translation initiation factor 3 110 kDa subunit [Methanocaldococcus lauensis]
MSSTITVDELLNRIQKLEKEIEKLKEKNYAETKEIAVSVAREEIKNEIRDELRKELATKEDLIIVKEKLRGEIWTKILIILIIISLFIPEVL